MNLEKLFGETVFEEIICLDTGADKDAALEPYRDSGLYFIEDKIQNAETAEMMGIRGILVEHGHNMDYSGPIPMMKNWKQIYDFILGQ
jgi:hypothetical protein